MADEKVKISFDGEYKVRVLESAKFKKGQDLTNECAAFVDKISTFSEKVNSLVDVLELHAARIDAQKLRAIGLRMASENESEQRSRQQRALQAVVAEKRAELDKYNAQYQSLERIESEQRATLEKLTNSS